MPPNLKNQSTRNSSDNLNSVPHSPPTSKARLRSRSQRSRPGRRRNPWVQAPPQRPVSSAAAIPTPAPPNADPGPGDENNWSATLEAVLEQPPSRLPQMLLLGGLVFISSLGVWSWFGKFDQIGYAQGKLVPQGNLYKVHSAEAGKIISLNVSEGERLEEGDLIAVLDNNLAQGEVERLQQVVQTTRLQLLQQQQLLEQLSLEVQSRKYISDAEVQAQQVAINQAALQVETSLKLLMQSQSDLLGYEERLGRLEPLVVEGAIARERLFEVEQQMRDRQSNVIQNRGSVAQAQTEVEQLQALLQQRMAEGQRSELESQQQVQGLLLQITELQGRLQENETLLRSARSRLQQYFLYAPVSGLISSLAIKNPGEVIQPGQTLLEMRSGDDPLVLEAFISSAEAGFVEEGMPVKVKFDAYPYQKFGVIPGVVVFRSPDSNTNPQNGATQYRIKVKLERHYIVSENERVELQAGQTAIAEIIIRRRRIIDIVLEPIQQLRTNSLELEEEAVDGDTAPATESLEPSPLSP